MIEVSLPELKEFILSQPDEREQRMTEGGRHSAYGSFLVHYGLARNWTFNFIVCDKWIRYHKTASPETIAKINGSWLPLFKKGADLGTTYADLKRNLV